MHEPSTTYRHACQRGPGAEQPAAPRLRDCPSLAPSGHLGRRGDEARVADGARAGAQSRGDRRPAAQEGFTPIADEHGLTLSCLAHYDNNLDDNNLDDNNLDDNNLDDNNLDAGEKAALLVA
jgi:hypothetical protein